MARRKGDQYKHERWLVAQMAEVVALEMEEEAFHALVKDLMRLRYQITLQEAQAEAFERTRGKFFARAKVVCYAVLDHFKSAVINAVARGENVDIGEFRWYARKRAARAYRIPIAGVGMVEGVAPATTLPVGRFSRAFRRRVAEEAPRPAVPVPAAVVGPGGG